MHLSAYHAGLKDAQRGEVQNKWMSGQTQVMVATIAFGSLISLLFWYLMPEN